MMCKGLNGQGVPQFDTMSQKELEKLLTSVADQIDRDFNPRRKHMKLDESVNCLEFSSSSNRKKMMEKNNEWPSLT
ncbi:hypothetical protein CHS0354_008334 [Potamilus streckersoni]|uniref:Uncharacterized protein n=1 Tax=Potamilus streckersoni TaxID=2493646 RepID=A0AAE0SC97_9BIVA|nr:hypothetical protein CHS0354_008334 [Potamilus streckersoni]